jgi:hypothetical protein
VKGKNIMQWKSHDNLETPLGNRDRRINQMDYQYNGTLYN